MHAQFPRFQKLPQNHHFFLFGARNTGKSTLLEAQFDSKSTLLIDLLDDDEYMRFSRNPKILEHIVSTLPNPITHVIIDEIQRVPKLLNTIQRLMRNSNQNYVMTGSSARKLKRGGANLLAGRAFIYHLFPLSHLELGESFKLEKALGWGTLPEVFQLSTDQDRHSFLHAYANIYLKEEIWEEQLIRQLNPFQRFLEVAAQSNGELVNYSNIAHDVGVDDKTVKNYFSILEDTLIGFYLPAYHTSIRKRLKEKPKFYFFDTGVVRALARRMTAPLNPGTSDYGNAFEHFVILECIRLADYFKLEYRFSFLRTQNDVEIDLIVERPDQPLLCIEIKSARHVDDKKLTHFLALTKDLPHNEAVCFCQERYPRKLGHVILLPWKQGLKQFFTKM